MGMNETQRRLVHAIFLYTCIEGLVVNFFYPNPLAYLPKDVLIAFLYLGLISNPAARGGGISRLSGPFGAFAAVCLFYIVMPTPVSPVGISVAIKQRLFYIPLMYAGYYYLRGDADLAYLLRLIAWSAVPVSLFGIYLYFGGPYVLRDLGADYSHAFFSTAGESGVFFWRVPGTFNSPGQFGAYLSTVATLLVGFLLVKDLSTSDRRMILIALACIIPAMLVTGSRAPLLIFVLLAGLTAMLSRQLSRAGVVAGVFYVLVVISLNYLGSGVADRVASIVSAENVERAQSTLFGQLWVAELVKDPLGQGLGVATVGARHFSPAGTVRLVESYLGILAAEMGVLGALSFMVFLVLIARALLQSRAWMADAPGRSIWTAAFLLSMLTVVLTTNNTGLDAIPGNLYFWFLLGVLIKMVDLERTRLMWARMAAGTGAGGDRS